MRKSILPLLIVLSLLILPSLFPMIQTGNVNGTDGEKNSRTSLFPQRTLVPLYYASNNYTKLKVPPQYSFDSNGVIMMNLSGTYVYQPYWVAKYATEIYCYWYNTNDSTPLTEFQAQIDWIRQNEVRFGDHSLWYYEFDNPWVQAGRDTDPWWSALSNGFTIAALLESYALYGNETDLQIAWRGLKSFRYSLEDHGFLTNWNGTVWYEEEGDNSTLVLDQPSHILNGMMYSVGCVKYVHEFNGSAYALSIFNDGITALKVHAREFDTGMWQRYSMIYPWVSAAYMILHEECFNSMASLSNDPEMRDWYNRSVWMHWLANVGILPVNVTADSTINATASGPDRLVDKTTRAWLNPSNHYWSGYCPADLIFDLGSVRPVNFIGYYGSQYFYATPRNWTAYSSLDGVNWVLRATVVDSIEFDKAVVFNSSIQMRYVKISISTINSDTKNIVALDEVMIADLTGDDLRQAKISIEDHRFKHVDGRLTGSVPQGTIVWVDDGPKVSVQNGYSYWLSNGPHYLRLARDRLWINKSIYVNFAQTVYFNATNQTFIDIGMDLPSANAGPDVNISQGATWIFNASGSVGYAEIVNYTWTFTYSGNPIRLFGVAPSFKFDVPGVYNLTLTVRDAENNTDQDWLIVIVSPASDSSLLLIAAAILIAISSVVIILFMRKRRRSVPPEDETALVETTDVDKGPAIQRESK